MKIKELKKKANYYCARSIFFYMIMIISYFIISFAFAKIALMLNLRIELYFVIPFLGIIIDAPILIYFDKLSAKNSKKFKETLKLINREKTMMRRASRTTVNQ